jgi:two-component system sensor histidine kinase DctS
MPASRSRPFPFPVLRRLGAHWRPVKRRDSASGLSIAAILLITLLLGVLLAVIHKSEVDEERRSLIKTALWAEQTLRLQLSTDEERLLQLAGEFAKVPAGMDAFLLQARWLIGNRPEVERVLLLDAAGRPALTIPPREATVERADASRDTFLLARALGRRAYSPPLSTPSGSARIELHQPVFQGQTFTGMVVAVISLPALLDAHLPWWFAERYRVEITDATGAPLAAKSRVPAEDDGVSHTIAFDPPGHGLSLVATLYQDETNLTRNLLVAAILALALAAVASIWSVRSQISRRVKAEQQLRAEHAFRKAMEDSLTVGMRARDLTGRITYVNPAFCRMVGYSQEELVGAEPPMPYWAPDDLERTLELHAVVMSGQAPTEGFEIGLRRRDGSRFDALIYEAPLIDADGSHTGWMGSVVDITERRRAEELARQQRDKLQHTARLVVMGEMASAIAHELNQPLSAIASYATGCINRLQDGDADGQQILKVLAKLSYQAQRAGHIIRRVYSFVRKSEPKIGPCDLAAVLEDCTALMRPEANRRGIRFALDIAEDLGMVEADTVQIGQVVANLARNGMEAMAATERTRRVVTIAARADDGGVIVSVRDAGSGIAPEIAENLFEPFFTTKEEGMGMGLNICRSIIEHHRGRLWFEPNPGGGSTFLFTLPAVRP